MGLATHLTFPSDCRDRCTNFAMCPRWHRQSYSFAPSVNIGRFGVLVRFRLPMRRFKPFGIRSLVSVV